MDPKKYGDKITTEHQGTIGHVDMSNWTEEQLDEFIAKNAQ